LQERNMLSQPFHKGELEVQRRLGVQERLDEVGRRVIRAHMPEQHRELFARLPVLLVAAMDRQGHVQATVLAGRPGFIDPKDERHLLVSALPVEGDPLHDALQIGRPVGLLGLELETRRRNRMDGTVVEMTPSGFTVRVDLSFGNCAQYINARHLAPVGPGAFSMTGTISTRCTGLLKGDARRLVEQADTLFIASAARDARGFAGADGVDVSHRGGLPGFVRCTEEGGATVLTMPDYRGNFFFNTLGNIVQRPQVGLLFIDFERGDLLHLQGHAAIDWTPPNPAEWPGAKRLVRFRTDEAVWRPCALGMRWSAPQVPSEFADLTPLPPTSAPQL
jgi:uncharacterized protein